MDPETPAKEAPKPKRPSLAFSWATLGFILGALFVWAQESHREAPAAPPPVAPAPVPPPARRRTRPLLTTIEAVFEEWQKYAVWEDDTTEVALFDGETKTFSDTYEVLRQGGNLYFRSIPELTRPVLTHGVPEGSPLEFTETEEQREEWLRDVNEENWKSIQRGIRTSKP